MDDSALPTSGQPNGFCVLPKDSVTHELKSSVDSALPAKANNDRQSGALDRDIENGHLTARFRLIGFFPLLFFVLHANYYREMGGLPNMLWMCNIGNLVLALGLFLAWPSLIRVAVIWLLPGLPIWLWFVVRPGWWILTSFFAHAGGLIVGLIAIRRVRASRWMWLQALLWYLSVQEICRLLTPPGLNLNAAHQIYPGFETIFNTYREFWIVGTLVVATGLWIVGFALMKLFPPTELP